MGHTFFREFFPSTFDAMGNVLNRAVHALHEHHCISKKDEPCTRMCLEEALVNAIRHGNKNDAASRVGLEMAQEGDACTIKVYDQGSGFSPDAVRLPDPSQIGGRGVCLMRHYMENVAYDAAKHCLALTLRRKASVEKEPAAL